MVAWVRPGRSRWMWAAFWVQNPQESRDGRGKEGAKGDS